MKKERARNQNSQAENRSFGVKRISVYEGELIINTTLWVKSKTKTKDVTSNGKQVDVVEADEGREKETKQQCESRRKGDEGEEKVREGVVSKSR